MYWGYSPALDLQELITKPSEEPLNFLIVGSSDARHVLKTISQLYLHDTKRKITFHLVEHSLEEIARSILLLSTCFEKNIGLQEATRYYLEILGNSLIRPATAKFLISRAKFLTDIITETETCDWLDLKELKYKQRDGLENLYKFWALGASENISTSKIWDLSIRRSLGTRYDHKKGVFDWDYYMILKSRDIKPLSSHDYIFWRESGVAFVWIEGEPIRGNPTFIALNERLQPFYIGDIRNGPFFTWITEAKENDRISDMAEKQVMCAIYETHNGECMDDKKFAAHRDASLSRGIIQIKLDDMSSEQESWSKSDKVKQKKADVKWTELSRTKIKFYDMNGLKKLQEKRANKFDSIWLGQKVSGEYRNVYSLLEDAGLLLTETRQFLVDYKDEEVKQFESDLRKDATENGLTEIETGSNFKAVLSFEKK